MKKFENVLHEIKEYLKEKYLTIKNQILEDNNQDFKDYYFDDITDFCSDVYTIDECESAILHYTEASDTEKL